MISETRSFRGLAILTGALLLLALDAAQAQDPTTRTVTTTPDLSAPRPGTGRRILGVESPSAPLPSGGLRFNFKGVPLDTVLDYLSSAAGFVIVRDATLEGRVDVVSHRDLSRDEAVTLLNTVLNQKGYAAIRNEQTLKIVTLEDARKRDIPVQVGRDPNKIRKTDEMITQVIPVHYAKVTQLVQNLEPLLPAYAVISANESSNAIILTATQTDIRRMVQIITSLDTSISNISMIKVFMLHHADATELAKLIGDLFKSTTGGNAQGGPPTNPMMMMFARRFGGGGGGGDGAPAATDASARSGGPTVTVVADTRTNALVVSAPEEVMPTLDQLITQVDTFTAQITEIRVFTLHFADAQNMADLINSIFQPTNPTSASSSANNQGGGGGFMRRFMGGGAPPSTTPTDSRKAQEATVLAVADLRTNSLVINADKDLMLQVALMIERLDKNPAKDRKVFVYPLKYADAQQTATILQDMFGNGTTNGASRTTNQSSIFNNNNTNGASQNSSNSSRNGSGGSVPGGMNF